MNFSTKLLVISAILVGFLVPQTNAQESKKEQKPPAGTWAWVHKTKSGGKTDCEMTVVAKKDKIKCTLTTGKKKFVSETAKFKDGVLSVAFSDDDGKKQFTFEGKKKGNSLRGKYSTADSGDKSLEWKAKKTVGLAEVVGTWSLSFETPDGVRIEPTIEVSQDKDGNPVVDFAGGGDQPTFDVTETLFKAGLLTVVTKVDYQGNELDAEWELKLKGNSAKGVLYFSFREVDNSGELAIEGERVK